MGSYTFRWEHPAEEVFVTGTFDDWKKSTKLDKLGPAHEKTVELPKSDDKILYKFVADGDWKHDPTAKTEQDHEGNTNNVLYPDDITPSAASALTFASVGPGATTTAMAGEQPVERSPPGAFPETPAASDDQTFSVNPIPASEGAGNPIQLAPGEPVPASSTSLTSGVHDDPELKSKDAGGEQTFGVAPIPATSGVGNPIQLTPGEPVPDPSTITSNTVQSTATTDKASYERADAGPPTLQDHVAPSTGVLGGPGPVIPESSMAMGNSTDISNENTGPTISSVGPGATTAALAGQQPIEPRGEPTVLKDSENPTISSVGPGATTAALAGEEPLEQRGVPEVVSESQQEAKADPEASGNPEAVEEKKEMEDELKKDVPEAPSTSESGMLGKSEDGVGAKAAAGVAAAGVAAAGAAVAANEMIKDKTGTDAKSALPQSVQDTVDEKAKESSIPATAAESSADPARETASTVPAEVQESQKEAGEPAEASASHDAVKEKSAMEQELLSKVPESEAKGAPAPTESAATAESAPAPTTSTDAPQLGDPTAGVAALSMEDKSAEGAGDGGAAVNETPTQMDSRDVSPMSKPATQQEPQVVTGVATTSTPAKSDAQKRQSIVDKLKNYKPESPQSSSSKPTSESKKKENRRSFFGKIKDKLKYDKQEATTADVVADSPSRDTGRKSKAVDDDNINTDRARTYPYQDRNILNSPSLPNLPSPATISSPPPHLPPRKPKPCLDPGTLPQPFIPPPAQAWLSKLPLSPPPPRMMHPPKLQLPQSADEASLLSRGNARAQRTKDNSNNNTNDNIVITVTSTAASSSTDPSPTEPSYNSSIQNSDLFMASRARVTNPDPVPPSSSSASAEVPSRAASSTETPLPRLPGSAAGSSVWGVRDPLGSTPTTTGLYSSSTSQGVHSSPIEVGGVADWGESTSLGVDSTALPEELQEEDEEEEEEGLVEGFERWFSGKEEGGWKG